MRKPLIQRSAACSENAKGVAFGHADQIVRIAAYAHLLNGMAGNAADAGVGGGIVVVVEVNVIETPAEERCGVVAAGTESRRLDVAVPGEQHAPRFAHRERIGRIVERCEAMRAVLPIGVSGGVAARAVVIAHEMLRVDEFATDGASERWFERNPARGLVGAGRRRPDSNTTDDHGDSTDASAHRPTNRSPGQAMQHKQPAGHERRRHMRPIRH